MPNLTEITMNTKNFSSSSSSAQLEPRRAALQTARVYPLEAGGDLAAAVAERKAERIVSCVVMLRLVVPVALITMILASTRPSPKPADVATLAGDVKPITAAPAAPAPASSTEYFPAGYVNHATVVEDHVQNF